MRKPGNCHRRRTRPADRRRSTSPASGPRRRPGRRRSRLGRAAAAIEEYGRALELARSTSAGYGEVAALIGLAGSRRPADARRDAELALSLAVRRGYRSLEGQARTALAAAHLALGRTAPAREEALRALDVHRETGHRPGERRTCLLADLRVEAVAT